MESIALLLSIKFKDCSSRDIKITLRPQLTLSDLVPQCAMECWEQEQVTGKWRAHYQETLLVYSLTVRNFCTEIKKFRESNIMRTFKHHLKSDNSYMHRLRNTDLVLLWGNIQRVCVLDKNEVKKNKNVIMSKALRACLFERTFCFLQVNLSTNII